VKPERRDSSSRRVTSDLIDFHIKRGHQLRIEFYRKMWRAVWNWLISL
jgi:hypothetical protein